MHLDSEEQYKKKVEYIEEMFEKIQNISPIHPREIVYLMQIIFCIAKKSLLSHEKAFSSLNFILDSIYKKFEEYGKNQEIDKKDPIL